MKGLAAKRNFSERFIQVVEALKEDKRLGLKTDTSVALALNLLPQQINRIRNGTGAYGNEILEASYLIIDEAKIEAQRREERLQSLPSPLPTTGYSSPSESYTEKSKLPCLNCIWVSGSRR